MSGLYLQSPASEGMWMGEQSEAHWKSVPARFHIRFWNPHRLFLASISINTQRREAMSAKENHHKINYIEFPSTDIERTKKFYSAVFGWTFVDYGPEYVSFQGAGIDGGFIKVEPHDGAGKFAPLVILYSSDLAATEIAVRMEGGGVVVPTFEFPGGRRFHFSDGVGNVLGVWSE
jgi:uncharacterized protein